MPVNVLLVLWRGGYWEVADLDSIIAHGRHEDFLDLGAIEDFDNMLASATAQLAEFARPREEIVATPDALDPADDYVTGYRPGDSGQVEDSSDVLVTRRVLTTTVTED